MSLFGFTRLIVQKNHQNLMRILHILGDILSQWKSRVPDIAVIHNEIQPVSAKIELKPRKSVSKRLVMKDGAFAVFLYGDLDIKRTSVLASVDKIGQIPKRGLFSSVLGRLVHNPRVTP